LALYNQVHESETTTEKQHPKSLELPEPCYCERRSKGQVVKDRRKEVQAAETDARQRMKQWKKDRKRKKRKRKSETCNFEKVGFFWRLFE
jgi:hypothetical protein